MSQTHTTTTVNLFVVDGEVHAHGPNCADPKRKTIYRDLEASVVEVASVQEIIEIAFEDPLGKSTKKTWEDYADSVKVFPCTGITARTTEEGMTRLGLAMALRAQHDKVLPAELKEKTITMSNDDLKQTIAQLVDDEGVETWHEAFVVAYWRLLDDGTRVACSEARIRNLFLELMEERKQATRKTRANSKK